MNYEKLILDAEKELKNEFLTVDKLVFFNSKKILDAFHTENIAEVHFNKTTGYGYGDIGRDAVENVYKKIFKAEDALVRSQIISGSHALTVALFSCLRPKDKMLIISGDVYDTIKPVIGIEQNASSLKSFDIDHKIIDLVDDDFDDERILKELSRATYKLVYIQRSRGYSLRKSLTIDKLERIISKIKAKYSNTIVMVDNCYCELVNEKEPTEVGADLVVGSLIKNMGAGIATNGGYIVGKKDLVWMASERLNLPSEGKEVGPSSTANRDFLMGVALAPKVVGESLKFAILSSYVLEKLGYTVSPRYNEKRADIVDMIIFNNREKLIKFVQGIQKASLIDSNSLPEPTDMPGYKDQIIMASGSFTQGSSIELSCDAPLKEPFAGYLQGSLTYEYGKLALITALENMEEK